jgi:hypothetical protein
MRFPTDNRHIYELFMLPREEEEMPTTADSLATTLRGIAEFYSRQDPSFGVVHVHGMDAEYRLEVRDLLTIARLLDSMSDE